MWTDETRQRHARAGPRYPSDLTNAERALIEPHIPPPRRGGRRRKLDMREVVQDRDAPARVLDLLDPLWRCDTTRAFGTLGAFAAAWRLGAHMTRSLDATALPGAAASVVAAQHPGGAATLQRGRGSVGRCPGAVRPAPVLFGWPGLAMILSGMARTRWSPAARARSHPA